MNPGTRNLERYSSLAALIRAMRSASEPVSGTSVSGGEAPVPGVLLATGIGSAGGGGRSGRTVTVASPTDGSMSASTRRGRSRAGGLGRPRFASPARGVFGATAAFRLAARVTGLRVARFAPLARGVVGVAFVVRVVVGGLPLLVARLARPERERLRVASAFRAVARAFVFRAARIAFGFPAGRERFFEGRGRLADARGLAFDRGLDFANEGSSEI